MFRDAKGRGIPNKKYSDSLIEEVCEYYAKHGKIKTRDKFPEVNVRTVVERYKHDIGVAPRQVRWKDEEIVKVVLLARTNTKEEIAKEMNRPNAHTGSIKSIFSKRLNLSATKIAGLPYAKVVKNYKICEKDIPWHRLESRRICYWSDILTYLRPNVSSEIRRAIETCVMFEKWLTKEDK